jgi:hypothetical protein
MKTVRDLDFLSDFQIHGTSSGEIFGPTWGGPKTTQSARKAALSQGLLLEIERSREFAIDLRPGAWVFPSERLNTAFKGHLLAQTHRAKPRGGWS